MFLKHCIYTMPLLDIICYAVSFPSELDNVLVSQETTDVYLVKEIECKIVSYV